MWPRLEGLAEADLDGTSPHSEHTRMRAARTGIADAPAGIGIGLGKRRQLKATCITLCHQAPENELLRTI